MRREGVEVEGELSDRLVGEVGKTEDGGLFAMNVTVPGRSGDGAARGESKVGLAEEKVETS